MYSFRIYYNIDTNNYELQMMVTQGGTIPDHWKVISNNYPYPNDAIKALDALYQKLYGDLAIK